MDDDKVQFGLVMLQCMQVAGSQRTLGRELWDTQDSRGGLEGGLEYAARGGTSRRSRKSYVFSS